MVIWVKSRGKGNKYFWLKLQRDFFKRHDIRIVEGMDNGKDYILFYMKLLLESIDHEGYLRFSDTVPYNEKMLSIITNTNVDIVRAAIEIFKQLKLMEILDDKTIYMTQTQQMLGQETEWAVKKREYREKQKQILIEQGTRTTMENEGNKDNMDNMDIVLIDGDDEKEQKEIKVDYDELFDRFWKAYPKKVGKDKCSRWFKTHKVTEDFVNDLVLSLQKQSKSQQWSKNKGQYIPHPYTWLNRGGWNDELEYAEPIEQKIKNRWEKFIDER